MIEYRSTAAVIEGLKHGLQDESDPLEWIWIELAVLERQIKGIRQQLHKLGAKRTRTRV